MLEERAKLVQSVIDRILEFGDEYINELELLNSKYKQTKYKMFENLTPEEKKSIQDKEKSFYETSE